MGGRMGGPMKSQSYGREGGESLLLRLYEIGGSDSVPCMIAIVCIPLLFTYRTDYHMIISPLAYLVVHSTSLNASIHVFTDKHLPIYNLPIVPPPIVAFHSYRINPSTYISKRFTLIAILTSAIPIPRLETARTNPARERRWVA